MNKKEFDEILRKIEESNFKILIPKKIETNVINEINKNLGLCMGKNILELLDDIAEEIMAREPKLVDDLEDIEEIEKKLCEQLKEAEKFTSNIVVEPQEELEKMFENLLNKPNHISNARTVMKTDHIKEDKKKCSCNDYKEKIKNLEEANKKMSEELYILRDKVKKYSEALINLGRADIL